MTHCCLVIDPYSLCTVADQIFKVVQRVDHPHPQHVLEPMSVTKNPVGRS